MCAPTHAIPHALGIKTPNKNPTQDRARGLGKGEDVAGTRGYKWHIPTGRHSGMVAPHLPPFLFFPPPAGVFPGGLAGQAGGAAGRADEQEHHPVPGGVQGLPGTAALQEEEGSWRLSPPRSAAQFRLKWAAQLFCRRLAQRLLLPPLSPPPREPWGAVGSRGASPGAVGSVLPRRAAGMKRPCQLLLFIIKERVK